MLLMKPYFQDMLAPSPPGSRVKHLVSKCGDNAEDLMGCKYSFCLSLSVFDGKLALAMTGLSHVPILTRP